MGTQHLSLLERHLRMGRMAVARLVAQAAAGGLAVAAAFAGWGVWALVVQQYVELLVLGGLAWSLEAWRPNWPWRGERVPDPVRFGGYFSLNTLLTTLAHSADNILLSVALGGSEAGRAMLGMYAQAANLMIKPVYVVTTPVNTVALAALSRAHGDRANYATQVAVFLRLVGIVLFPTGVGLALVARDFMLVLGGEKWREAGVLLEALAPTITALGLILLCTFVFVSADRGGRLVAASVVKTLLFMQGYAAGYYLGAVYLPPPLGPALGVAWSHSFVAVLVLGVPYLVYCLRSVGVSPWPVLRGLARPLLSALVMGVVVWGLRRVLAGFPGVPPEGRLAALVALGVCVYLLLARRELAWLSRQFLWSR
jgi:PST family polysaccharide transporter